MSNELQRTDEWFEQRRGKITASRVSELFGNGRNSVFTLATEEYLRKVIAEILTGETAKISGKALEWGTEQEPYAIAAYSKAHSLVVEEVGFVPLKSHEAFAGGSPDGLIPSHNKICEVKCPFDSGVHVETLITKDIPSKWQKKYYAQIQFNMLCTDTTECDFISFDPRMKDDKDKLFVKTIPRDDEYLQDLVVRLTMAINYIKINLAKIKGCKIDELEGFK